MQDSRINAVNNLKLLSITPNNEEKGLLTKQSKSFLTTMLLHYWHWYDYRNIVHERPHPKLLSIVIIYNKGLVASVVFGSATIHIFILITTDVGNTRIHL